ncbi:MAG: glycosyltransferase family 39 protein [Anaerolineae bacterium]|nr:glycosyltransferase family 39 protein [Anaerolineae bacterium]
MNVQSARSRRWERLALLVILITGAWLRFQHIGAIEYNIDQVYPVWQAFETVDAGDLPLTGQGTSVLFANPPLTGYLFVPVIALTRQPIAAYMLTLTLNTLAIWLAFRALRRLTGTRPALVGAALLAANPWIIEDSRRTWVQSLMPFFVCLIFWALVLLTTSHRRLSRRYLLIVLVGLALFANTYLLAYALVAPVALLLIVFRRRWADPFPWRTVILGGGVFVLLMGLYAVGLLQDRDATSRRARDFAAGSAQLTDEALTHAVRLVTGWEYAAARGTGAPANDADQRGAWSDALHLIWLLVLVGGLGRALLTLVWRQNSDPHTRDTALVLLAWFVLPVIMMSYVSRVVHPFYLLLTIPAGHGLAAWGAAPLFRRRNTAGLLIALVVITGVINGLNTVRFAEHTAAHPGEDLPTLPLAESMELGQRIRETRHENMTLTADIDPWTPITITGNQFRVERLTGLDQAVLIPPDGALTILYTRGDTIAPPLGAHPASEPLILRDGAQITFWHTAPADIQPDHPAEIPSDIDVTFAGWTLDGMVAPGHTVTLITVWRVETLHPDRGVWAFAPFAHLIDSSGNKLAVADGRVIPALAWEPGDLLVQRIALDIPAGAAGPFGINVGLFDSVRLRDDGTPGINAVFRIPSGSETQYTVVIPIIHTGNNP